MIISVASGKGGTGKTTVATNLACAINDGVQLLDCDVEEPNAHLFLKPEILETQKVTTPIPEVDESKCTYCGKCAEICRFKAIAVVAEAILVFSELCHSCGGCVEVCPENAIKEVGRELGTAEKGNVRPSIDFINGRLRVTEAMSPPLIKHVKSKVLPNKINIIDAPPGTSCPVIAAMQGADFVLMVTEPTPFGLHDLELANEAVKLLGIPRGLVINRSDMGDDKVKAYAHRENLPILMEIPFDRKIAESYSRGVLISHEDPQWKEKFFKLFTSIKDLAANGFRIQD